MLFGFEGGNNYMLCMGSTISAEGSDKQVLCWQWGEDEQYGKEWLLGEATLWIHWSGWCHNFHVLFLFAVEKIIMYTQQRENVYLLFSSFLLVMREYTTVDLSGVYYQLPFILQCSILVLMPWGYTRFNIYLHSNLENDI